MVQILLIHLWHIKILALVERDLLHQSKHSSADDEFSDYLTLKKYSSSTAIFSPLVSIHISE